MPAGGVEPQPLPAELFISYPAAAIAGRQVIDAGQEQPDRAEPRNGRAGRGASVMREPELRIMITVAIAEQFAGTLASRVAKLIAVVARSVSVT